MRGIALLLIAVLAVPVGAQEKKPARKAAKPAAHTKPTPQQMRRFNELEKKQQPKEKKK